MKKIFVSIMLIVTMLFATMLFGCTNSNVKKIDFSWSNITTAKYRNDDNVHSLIAVKYKGGYNAEIIMYEKDTTNKNVWTESLRCNGIVGKNGIEKVKEGDGRTPLGDYGIGKVFGLKKNPGTKLEYIDIDENLYCCGDETTYNQFIDINDFSHDCKGEHMFDYSPAYNYGFEIMYNSDNVYGKGSAIFFHCIAASSYTMGCIAVPEEDMKYILTKIDDNTRVIINYSD